MINRFHPWCVVLELRVPVIRLASAGGDDQAVVGDPTTSTNRVDGDLPGVEIDVHDFAKRNLRVPLVPKHAADRRRDVPLGENPGRELIEQRLKQVVIRPVDDGDLHIGAAQRFSGKQSAEPAADDHDLVPARRQRARRFRVNRIDGHGPHQGA